MAFSGGNVVKRLAPGEPLGGGHAVEYWRVPEAPPPAQNWDATTAAYRQWVAGGMRGPCPRPPTTDGI